MKNLHRNQNQSTNITNYYDKLRVNYLTGIHIYKHDLHNEDIIPPKEYGF